MSDDQWDRLVTAAKNGLRSEGNTMINEALGNMGALMRPADTLIANPLWGDDDDEGDDDEGVEVETDGIAFEYDDAADNLAGAAGAYRFLGGPEKNPGDGGDIVAQHKKTGRAFFGTVAEFDDYRNSNDLQGGWKVYRKSSEILDLEYDQDTIRDLVRELDREGLERAREMFAGFHWGDESGTVVMKDIEGIDGPLTTLGVARRIEYFAIKDGEPVEYYHDFGEESKVFPTLYALGEKTLCIHGGMMRVEDRGIVE